MVGFPEGVTRPDPEAGARTTRRRSCSPARPTGSTGSASTAPTTTTRCGPRPRSSASPSMFHGGLGHMPSGSFTATHELHVQPHRLVRPAHALAVQVAVHGRRHQPLPDAQLRLPRVRRRLGGDPARRHARALGEAQPRGPRSASTRRRSTGPSLEALLRQPRRRPARPRPATSTSTRRCGRCPAPARRPTTATSGASSTSAPSASSSTCSSPSFYFGCEADDRTIAFAFSPANPFGARLQPVFSSATSATGTCPTWPRSSTRPTAWCARACSTEQDFREFVFENPARLLLRPEPRLLRRHRGRGRDRPLADADRAPSHASGAEL